MPIRYHENTEQSAEYLRLALQRLARQDAGLHPVSYALWYEYVAGINPALKAEVEAMMQGSGLLSEERYIHERQPGQCPVMHLKRTELTKWRVSALAEVPPLGGRSR